MSGFPPAPPPGQQPPPPGYPTDAVQRTRAEFGPRFVALIIDGLLGFALQLIPIAMVVAALFLGILSEALTIIVLILAFFVYLAVFFVWLYILVVGMAHNGQTPGKRAQGVKVVKTDGSALGFGGAIGRWFMQWLTNIPLYVGSLWMLWDEEQRTLYDKALDMDVVMVAPGSIFPLFPGGKPF